MQFSLHCAGDKKQEVFITSKCYQPITSKSWIVRVSWDIINSDDSTWTTLIPGAQELLNELNGEKGAYCSQMWVEFWFKNKDNAFLFYMVYG